MAAIATTVESIFASVAAPTLDVRVLTSAPQAALMLQSLSILAACTIDASLENNRTAGMIKLLTTPRSFRGSLYQTTASMSNAFRTADQAMLRININLNDIPSVITSLIKAYSKPGDAGSKFIMDLRMKNFEEIAKICTTEAERARQKFDDTLNLIQELIQVTTATQGDNEEKVHEAKKMMISYDEMRKSLQEQKQRLEQEISDQKKKIDEAKAQYNKAANKMTSLKHHVIGVFMNSFGSILSGISSFLSFGRNNFSGGSGKILSFMKPTQGGRDDANNTEGPDDTSVSDSGSSSYSKSLEAAGRMAKEVYLYQQQLHMVLLKEDAANRKEIAEIAAKLANSNVELLNLEEIIYYLGRGVKVLGRIQEQWTILQTFFASMESAVIGPMRRHLSDFGTIIKADDIQGSELLRQELAKSGIKAAAVCLSVSRAAHIYNQVSKIYVLPLVDKSVTKMIMTKEEAKNELPSMEQHMQQVTDESNMFIDQQLQEAENITVKQIMQTNAEFLTAFGVTTLGSLPSN